MSDTQKQETTSVEVVSGQERYDGYMAAWQQYRVAHLEQREGQAHFNVLYFGGFDPEFADEIRGTDIDPFYRDDRLPAYFDALRSHWNV